MNILTFDIEEWFHILDNDETRGSEEWKNFPSRVEETVQKLLKLLSDQDVRATFFCLGWVAERHSEMIRAIVSEGHDIGTHSYEHQLVYQQTPRDFEEDLKRSIGTLEDITGQKINKYRAPGFSLTEKCKWAFPILYRNGIRIDASIFPASRAHGGYKGNIPASPCRLAFEFGEILEFPMNTARIAGRDLVFSGGGYFRLFPLFLINRLINRSDYVMTYFHPRDFDPEQPVVPGLSFSRRFKSYVGLKSAEDKLRYLLEHFSWRSVSEYVEENSINSKRITL